MLPYSYVSKLTHNLNRGKNSHKMWTTCIIFRNLPRDNNHPLGENSPNLVTLFPNPAVSETSSVRKWFDHADGRNAQTFDDDVWPVCQHSPSSIFLTNVSQRSTIGLHICTCYDQLPHEAAKTCLRCTVVTRAKMLFLRKKALLPSR
jgi:hypothetical protein